jgi:SAM-dependent methyltransferase
MVEWCQQAITPRFPAFRFTTIDVANTHYNRNGTVAPGRARFPYEDAAFDFALATSLFTHMLPSGFVNYAREIARTMRPQGTLFATFFLLDDDVLERQERGATRIELRNELFEPDSGIGYRAMSRRTPETAVGLDAVFVTGTLAEAGFDIETVHRGSWAAGTDDSSYQDIVIARRRSPA